MPEMKCYKRMSQVLGCEERLCIETLIAEDNQKLLKALSEFKTESAFHLCCRYLNDLDEEEHFEKSVYDTIRYVCHATTEDKARVLFDVLTSLEYQSIKDEEMKFDIIFLLCKLDDDKRDSLSKIVTSSNFVQCKYIDKQKAILSKIQTAKDLDLLNCYTILAKEENFLASKDFSLDSHILNALEKGSSSTRTKLLNFVFREDFWRDLLKEEREALIRMAEYDEDTINLSCQDLLSENPFYFMVVCQEKGICLKKNLKK